MKSFEIQLKSGVAAVREDELDELIETLAGIKQSLSHRTYVDKGAAGYVDYSAAKKILQKEFEDNETHLTRRMGRLWSAIGRLAQSGDVAFDAYCKKCGTQLIEHTEKTECRSLIYSSSQIAVSVRSLRLCKRTFLSKRMPQVGRAVREDYVYLVEHLADA